MKGVNMETIAKESFKFGVKTLAELLLRLSVSDGHEGEVSYTEIQEAAKNLGVVGKLSYESG